MARFLIGSHLNYAAGFENGALTLKTDQMFPVPTTPGEFEDATIIGHFGFVVEENSDRKVTLILS